MIAEKKQADASTSAIANLTHKRIYRERDNQSSPHVKELLGFLLLRLIAGQAEPDGWELLDGLLRRFYAG
ncbi:MAG: hypothetical protein ABSG22_01295 [Sedimentisphaerales bacterium]